MILNAYKRWRDRRNTPWFRPRTVWPNDPLYPALAARLDEVARIGRFPDFYYRDRETGQLWLEVLLEPGPADIYGFRPVDAIPEESQT